MAMLTVYTTARTARSRAGVEALQHAGGTENNARTSRGRPATSSCHEPGA